MPGLFLYRFEEVVVLVVHNHHNQANLRHKLRIANTNPAYLCGLYCFTLRKLKTTKRFAR